MSSFSLMSYKFGGSCFCTCLACYSSILSFFLLTKSTSGLTSEVVPTRSSSFRNCFFLPDLTWAKSFASGNFTYAISFWCGNSRALYSICCNGVVGCLMAVLSIINVGDRLPCRRIYAGMLSAPFCKLSDAVVVKLSNFTGGVSCEKHGVIS